MMNVPPRLIRGFQLIALLVFVAMGVIKLRQILAMNECLEQGHRWDHARDVCADR